MRGSRRYQRMAPKYTQLDDMLLEYSPVLHTCQTSVHGFR